MEQDISPHGLRTPGRNEGSRHAANGSATVQTSGGRFERRKVKLHTVVDYAILFAIVIVGLIPRAHLLLISHAVIDADEAIVGLMAKHINEGRPFPIFYYGQQYMGSIEPLFAALSFRLLGMSSFALKVVPLVFSLIHIGLVYLLARRFTSRFGARVAALLTALAPVGLIHWSIMARGGFIELVVLGTAAFIIFCDILRSHAPRLSAFFALGLVLGLGWWMNNQIVFFMAPIGLLSLVEFPRCYGVRRSIRWMGAALTGFFMGGAPFWYANLTSRPRWQTFETLTKKQTDTSFFDHLYGYFNEALPIIFGARRFWSDEDLFPGAALILGGLVLVSLLLTVRHWGSLDGVMRSERPVGSQFALVLLFLFAVPVIFSASSFGWLSKAPRYLLPLYSVLYVVVGIAAAYLMGRKGVAAKAASLALVGSFLVCNLASNYLGGAEAPGQPFVFQGQRVADDHAQLYRWLDARGYRHIRTNYWIGYRIAFETEERITFTRFGTPRTFRIPEYELIGLEYGDDAPMVLVPREAALVKNELRAKGYQFIETAVGGYEVIEEFERIWPPAPELPLDAGQITVSSRPEWVPAMIDGDAGTRWGSGAPQSPGMFVEVRFPQPVLLSGIELENGFLVHDEPRILFAEAELTDGSWCELFSTEGTKLSFDLATGEFGAVARDQQFAFRPRAVRSVRLIQRGAHPVFDWSVSELKLFGEPLPAEEPSEGADQPEQTSTLAPGEGGSAGETATASGGLAADPEPGAPAAGPEGADTASDVPQENAERRVPGRAQ